MTPNDGPHPQHHAHGRAWGREEALAALESPERRLTQDPEALWNKVRLGEGATVVDVGAGTGYFTLPAARRVGLGGRVYAVDLSRDLLELIAERARQGALLQIVTVESTVSKVPLPSNIADVVLLANVLHDIPEETIAEAARLLKPEGTLVNLDWKKEETPNGPPLAVRYSPQTAARLLGVHGLEVVESWGFGPYHYGLLLRRPRGSTSRPRSRKGKHSASPVPP